MKLNLNKLLKWFMLDRRGLISALRDDIRKERDKQRGKASGGGDFHVPFWADAKLSLIANLDLRKATLSRIEDSEQRKRLYPELCRGFLVWLDGLRRRTNEKVRWSEENVHNHLDFDDLSLTLKVDNLLAINVGDRLRLVYPYFSEKPALNEATAKVGLWAMSEALPQYDIVDMEILDVLRGVSFKGDRTILGGSEEATFRNRFRSLRALRAELRKEYDF